MKKIILMLGVCASLCAHSQTVKRDANGNYTAVVRNDSTTGKPTGNTYTDAKGNVYPVMVTKTGKLYVIRTSAKTGKQYKQYLKVER